MLRLDTLGGTALHSAVGNQNEGRWLVVTEPNLRALDLHDDPHLEVLDLSGCGEQDVLHLQLDRLTGLREIYLPTLRTGAIIHRFNLEMPGSLTVHGRVSEFDADWQKGTLRLGEGMPAWSQLRVIGRDAQPDDVFGLNRRDQVHAFVEKTALSDSLVIVLCSDVLPEHLHLSGSSQWWIADASHVTELIVDGPSWVVVRQAGALESLTHCSAGSCEVEGANRLVSVHDVTRHYRQDVSEKVPQMIRPQMSKQLTLRGDMHALAFADGWGSIQLHAPRLFRLSVSWAKHLALYNCGHITDVALPNGLAVDCHGEVPSPLLNQAHFFMDESTLKGSLRRLDAGDDSVLEGILSVLSQRAAPHAAFYSLSTLCELAGQGISLSALWQCRRTLSAWQHHRSRKRKQSVLLEADYGLADKEWAWDLPYDRREEGLRADLNLWALCAAESKHAQSYRKTLLSAGQRGEPLGNFIHASTRENAPPALVALMLDILVTLDTSQRWRHLTHSDMYPCNRYLPRLLRAANNEQQQQAVMHAVIELMTWKDLAQQVANLHEDYPVIWRALVFNLSHQSDRWWRHKLPRRIPRVIEKEIIKAVRQALVQHALKPAGSSLDELQALIERAFRASSYPHSINVCR